MFLWCEQPGRVQHEDDVSLSETSGGYVTMDTRRPAADQGQKGQCCASCIKTHCYSGFYLKLDKKQKLKLGLNNNQGI